MRSATLALALFSVGCTGEDTEAVVETPIAPSSIPGALFYEPFTSHYESRWEVSTDEEFTGEWRWEGYKEPEAIPGDKGLVVGSQARRHAISTRFATPIVPKVQPRDSSHPNPNPPNPPHPLTPRTTSPNPHLPATPNSTPCPLPLPLPPHPTPTPSPYPLTLPPPVPCPYPLPSLPPPPLAPVGFRARRAV